MKFPNINQEICPNPPPEDCPDGATLPELMIQPELAVRCAPGTLTFKVFLVSAGQQIAINSGVVYSSSSASILSIDASSGQATALNPGIVTVTASWHGQMASAQVTVLGEGNCCEDVCVQTVVLQDNSQSMKGTWANGAAATKGQAARAIILQLIEALQPKDALALVSFNRTSTTRLELASEISDLQAAEMSTPVSSEETTNLSGALESALALLSVAPLCGGQAICGAGLHGHGAPGSDLGTAGDTYVDDDTGALYWRSVDGWHP